MNSTTVNKVTHPLYSDTTGCKLPLPIIYPGYSSESDTYVQAVSINEDRSLTVSRPDPASRDPLFYYAQRFTTEPSDASVEYVKMSDKEFLGKLRRECSEDYTLDATGHNTLQELKRAIGVTGSRIAMRTRRGAATHMIIPHFLWDQVAKQIDEDDDQYRSLTHVKHQQIGDFTYVGYCLRTKLYTTSLISDCCISAYIGNSDRGDKLPPIIDTMVFKIGDEIAFLHPKQTWCDPLDYYSKTRILR